MIGREMTEKDLKPAQARHARDGLAKLVYGKAFKWLVDRLNQSLAGKTSVSGDFIGVLDIAGFESFEVNSLEQLFINLSNEKLQQYTSDISLK